MGGAPVILHLIDSLGVGGAQQRLCNDLRYLNGPFVHRVYSLFDGGWKLPEELLPDVAAEGLGLRSLADLPRGVWRLARIIQNNPSVRLIHTQLFCADTVGRLVGRLYGRAVVSTSQSSIYEPDSGLNSSWRRWIDRWTARTVTRFVAVSTFVKRSLHTRLGIPLDRISVIPNSVDVNRVAPDPARRAETREQLQIGDGQFTWVTVGRLNPPKGYRYLLDGMARVVAQFPATRLLIVGDGPDRESLARVAEAFGLSQAVSFLGERTDVVALLDAADAFVFPSLSEGLPVAFLEAMAMAKPCVASRIGPHEELIDHGDTGLLVSPRDAAALAEAMCRVERDPLWARALGARARQRAARHFDAASCAGELRRLYEALLQEGRP